MEVSEDEVREVCIEIEESDNNNNNVDMRRADFSCPIFGGFETEIDIIPLNSKKEFKKIALERLRAFLKENKLHQLVIKLGNIDYHIHNVSWMDILTRCQYGDTVYLCNHNE
jgi:hypothetical protein